MSEVNGGDTVKDITPLKIGILWLKIALIYLIIGVVFGLVMSIKGNFQFASVHSHIGLMGWVVLAISGIIYCIFPDTGKTRLGYMHFWIFNIGLPVMLISLFLFKNGQLFFEPVLAISSIAYVIGVVCFALNIFINLRK